MSSLKSFYVVKDLVTLSAESYGILWIAKPTAAKGYFGTVEKVVDKLFVRAYKINFRKLFFKSQTTNKNCK